MHTGGAGSRATLPTGMGDTWLSPATHGASLLIESRFCPPPPRGPQAWKGDAIWSKLVGETVLLPLMTLARTHMGSLEDSCPHTKAHETRRFPSFFCPGFSLCL